MVEFNPAAETTFGYARDAVLGREMPDLMIPPEYRERHREGLARYLESGEGPILRRRIEMPAMRADGTIFPVELAITPIRAGGKTRFTAYLRDIGARKRAEQALRDREAQFRTLADNIPQLAWMAGPEGAIYWYNKRWYDYTGTAPGETLGWDWRKVHHPDHLERVEERLRACFAAGEPWEDTFPLRGADGGYRWFLSRALPIQDEDGRVVRWFGTNTDVTEQREAEEALAAAKESAEAANHAKSQFLANMSHELRTPLTAVIGYSEMLQEEMEDLGVESLVPDIRKIEANARHLLGLINDVLDLSKIEADRMELYPETFGAEAMVARRGGDRGGPGHEEGERAGARPRGRSGGDAHRPDPPAPVPDQPAEQRRQVHQEGPDHAEGVARTAGGARLARLQRRRHGHRHDARAARQAVRALHPGRRVDHPPLRRYRPRPRPHPRLRPHAGRGRRGGEHVRPGLDLHPPRAGQTSRRTRPRRAQAPRRTGRRRSTACWSSTTTPRRASS